MLQEFEELKGERDNLWVYGKQRKMKLVKPKRDDLGV